MMTRNAAHDFGTFSEPPCQVRADFSVRAFGLSVNSLPDVVKESSAPCYFLIDSEFSGDYSGDLCDLNAVSQNVLAVTEPEFELSDCAY